MTATLTKGAVTLYPTSVIRYRSSRPARTIVHELIDDGEPDYSLRDAGPRTGTLELVFELEADAAAAELAHAVAGVWTFDDPNRPTLGMSYLVAEGGIERELDDQTGAAWHVRVPYREVNP
jgi:hypothetical protein